MQELGPLALDATMEHKQHEKEHIRQLRYGTTLLRWERRSSRNSMPASSLLVMPVTALEHEVVGLRAFFSRALLLNILLVLLSNVLLLACMTLTK